jgi:Fic family protein
MTELYYIMGIALTWHGGIMRNYNFENWESLFTKNIISMLTQIHEYKGGQDLLAEANQDALTELVEVARIQSTEASNKIEGIYTSNDRLRKLVMDKTMPKTRNEEEIAGYRDILNTIHENFEHIPVKPSIILQLHRDLYKFNGGETGGKYKMADNIIEETDAEGNKNVRFKPVPAWETADSISELCTAYENAINEHKADPLLIIPVFILDFLCIHPFNDGNGRMSRILTLLLLYKAGYNVGRYISLEKIIEKTKDTYYDALQESSIDWHNEENDYKPFVEYTLRTILVAYREFSERVNVLITRNISKPDRIKEFIKSNVGKVTKQQIIQACPDVSKTTIERTLASLQNSNEIIKLGGGRYTSYIWNREEE